MQFEPNITIFDTTGLTIEHPISPEGYLFTYYPSESPEILHYHDFLEIGYCEKGTGVFHINGELIPFNDKCVSIVYGGQAHIARSINANKSLWHFLYIDLNCLFAGSELVDTNFVKRMKFNNWANYLFPQILPEKDYPEFYHICQAIMHEAASFNAGSLSVIQGLTYALLKMHDRLFADGNKTGQANKIDLMRELGEVINYLNENYTEDITIEDITRVAKMSKSNLQRKMIAFTGKAPLQYIHYLRMKYAIALLNDNRKSIMEIAVESGYNLSSFNRQFQKEFGCSPSAWRKTHSK